MAGCHPIIVAAALYEGPGADSGWKRHVCKWNAEITSLQLRSVIEKSFSLCFKRYNGKDKI